MKKRSFFCSLSPAAGGFPVGSLLTLADKPEPLEAAPMPDVSGMDM